MMIGAVVRAQLDNLKVNEQEGDFVGYSEQEASTQKSGLWRLPNVDVLLLPYNIDVMHKRTLTRHFGENHGNFGEQSWTFLIRQKIMLKLEWINQHYAKDQN